jgi:soluble cytochrome b562
MFSRSCSIGRPRCRRSLLLAVSLCVAGWSVPVASSAEEAAKTKLEEQMDEIGGAWRKVRRQVADAASNAETAALVATMKRAAEKSVTLEPLRLRDVEEAEREPWLEAYRNEMKAFVGMLGRLELALKEGRNADAEKLVAQIGAHQRASHKDFKRPDEK